MNGPSGVSKPTLRQDLSVVLATGLGIGNSPIIPGTLGSLWAVVIAWGLDRAGVPPLLVAGIAAAMFVIGIPLCDSAATRIGRKDPGSIVWDEIAALLLVLACIPASPWNAVLAFVWFRVFDMSKPWPIRRFERLPGGIGVMIDDMIAAVYALTAIHVTVYLAGTSL